MKTIKIILIAILIAFTAASLATADGFKEKPKCQKIVNLPFEKAVQNTGLTVAMCTQIDINSILLFHQHIYVARVSYNGLTYRITGTLDEWINFFRLKGKVPVSSKQRFQHVLILVNACIHITRHI